MSKIFFLFFLIFAILLEGTITSIPLVLDALLVIYILKRKSFLFILALISGIVLDAFSVRTLGSSSIYFVSFLFIVFLYERKFEIATYPFVFFASFLGGIAYLYLFGYNNVFWQGLIGSMVAVLLFRFACHPEQAKPVSGSRASRIEMPKPASPKRQRGE